MTSIAHTDGQAHTAELVDDAQHSECLSVVGAVSDEVIGADMIRSFPAADGCTSRR
jgi:hypothetical protein